jgi:hypothetical protein
MAWAVDQLTIGDSGSPSGQSFTTTAAVAAGSWIFVYMGNFGSSTFTSVSNTGSSVLTWEIVGQNNNGSVRVGLARAYAAAGLSTGAVISYTLSGAGGNAHIGGFAFSGGGSGSAIDTIGTSTGSTAAHSVTVNPAAAASLVIQVLHVNTAATANTPDGNSTENLDFSAGGAAQRGVAQHRIATGAGSYTVGGTCGVATWASLGASFTLVAPVPPNDAQGAWVTAGVFDPELNSQAWF